MKRAVSMVLLVSAVSLPAFDNLDFEQIPVSADTFTYDVPGWQHLSAIGGAGDYWNVNMVNLSGWAEAFVIQLENPTPFSPYAPIDGQFSMGFSASWPLLSDPGDTNNTGAAWIGQTGTIDEDAPWLTLDTDYTGPHIEYYDYAVDSNYFEVGYLTIYFDGTSVAFTLEDAGTGSSGQPLRQLRADLSPFRGQTGELRIGIEGPHTFIIDNIQLIPEPSACSLLVGVAAFAGMWKVLHRPVRRRAP